MVLVEARAVWGAQATVVGLRAERWAAKLGLATKFR
jgi:hypothetical protein